MPYIWVAQNNVEPIASYTIEGVANAALYNVISGCGLDYDAGNMTVDLAAGAIMHNGSPLQIAALANAFTIVSDPSNPRFTWLALNSSGAATIVSGTPAAAPAVPDLGDNVGLALLLVQAGQTIAANITYKLDKRVANPWGLVGYASEEATTTSTSAVDMITISKLGLADSIPTAMPIRILGQFRKTATAAQAVGVGLKLNSTIVLEAGTSNSALAHSTATQQAEDGWFQCAIAPRNTSYLAGITSRYGTYVSSSGAAAQAVASPDTLTALLPNAAVTSIVIRGINGTSNNNLAVRNIFVYAG